MVYSQFKANLLTQITEGTITWTATKGDWTPARKLVSWKKILCQGLAVMLKTFLTKIFCFNLYRMLDF